ncbi:MAG: copper chaperone PCu(A)C, partial [Bradyrhizobium sp.]
MTLLGRSLFALALLLAGSPAAFAADVKAGDLVITQPWSRATPGGAKTGAG